MKSEAEIRKIIANHFKDTAENIRDAMYNTTEKRAISFADQEASDASNLCYLFEKMGIEDVRSMPEYDSIYSARGELINHFKNAKTKTSSPKLPSNATLNRMAKF